MIYIYSILQDNNILLQGIPVMLPSAIGNTKNKYLLVPLLWPANETLK